MDKWNIYNIKYLKQKQTNIHKPKLANQYSQIQQQINIYKPKLINQYSQINTYIMRRMKLNIYVEPQLFNMELKKIPWNTLSHSHNINKKKKETMKELPIPSLTLCIFPKINSKKKTHNQKASWKHCSVFFRFPSSQHRVNLVVSVNQLMQKKKGKRKNNSTYEKPKCMLKPDKKKWPKFKSKSKWPNLKSHKQSPDETNK